MVILYFLGGENVSKQDAAEINSSALGDAGGSPRVFVFSWAKPSFHLSFERRRRLTSYLRSLGASEVSYADYSDSLLNIEEAISCSNLLYLTGGQVSTLLNRLKHKGVDRLLRNYNKVVLGRSAGALVLGQKCLVTNRYSGTRKVVLGLGLVDFSVKVHYHTSQDALLKEASRDGRIYAIPQKSALVFSNGVLSAIGNVQVFENEEKFAFFTTNA
jgi:peptidase E